MNEQYSNLETNAFIAQKNETTTLRAKVQQNVSGFIQLTRFALIQIIAGAGVPALTTSSKAQADEFIKLLSKLALHWTNYSPEDESTPLNLIREEVTLCRQLLEARVSHCEWERDNGFESFNPDTYISQKLLLLDIREWLMVSVIEEEKVMGDVRHSETATGYITH